MLGKSFNNFVVFVFFIYVNLFFINFSCITFIKSDQRIYNMIFFVENNRNQHIRMISFVVFVIIICF